MINKFSIVEFYQPNKSRIKEEHLPSKRGRKTRAPKRGEMRVVSTDKWIQLPSMNARTSDENQNVGDSGVMNREMVEGCNEGNGVSNSGHHLGMNLYSNHGKMNEMIESKMSSGSGILIDRPISMNFPFNHTMHTKKKDISMPLIPTIPKIEKTSKTKTQHPQKSDPSSLQRKVIRTSISIQELLN